MTYTYDIYLNSILYYLYYDQGQQQKFSHKWVFDGSTSTFDLVVEIFEPQWEPQGHVSFNFFEQF